MQKWEYTFPPTSKENWIQQLEKDLKGKPVESLNSEWWPGEPLVPFHYSNENEPIILPDFLFKDPPQITEFIDIDGQSAHQINKMLHDALPFGTQTFLITKKDATALEGVLDGIFPEMINWHFYASENVLPIYSRLVSLSPDTTFVRINRSGPDVDLSTAFREKNLDSSNIKFEYIFPAEGNWIEEASRVFQTILDDWKQWNEFNNETPFADKCILRIDLGDYYFKHLIQIRVLHLLWLNLTREQKIRTGEQPGYLECHVLPKSEETFEKYLIRASMSSLAAFLTGTHSLCIHHPVMSSTTEFYKRIDRNLHHLLHLESGLPSGKDPLAGAYTLDYYTRSWTQRIWDKLS